MTYLDTHVVIRLFLGDLEKLSERAQQTMEDDEDELLVSPAVVLELELLHEIKRLDATAQKLIAALEHDVGLGVSRLPFRSVVQHALGEKWTRDPFDRLIVANAKASGARLVTKDEKIRRHYSLAIW